MKKQMILLTIVFVYTQCKNMTQSEYPFSKKEDSFVNYHGDIINDEFEWLENESSNEVDQWKNSQEAYLNEYLTDIDSSLIFNKITDYSSIEKYRSPIRIKDGLLFTKLKKNQTQPLICLKTRDSLQIIFDPIKELSKDENFTGFIYPSRDGNILGLLVTQIQSRWGYLYFYDIRKRKLLLDKIENIYWGRSGISWNPKGDGLYYTQFQKPNVLNETAKFSKIKLHQLGTPNSKDKLIYESNSAQDLFTPYVSNNGDQINIIENSGVNHKLFSASILTLDFKLISSGSNLSYIGQLENSLFYTSYDNFENGEVLLYDSNSEISKVIVKSDNKSIRSANIVGTTLIVVSQKDMQIMFDFYDLNDKHIFEKKLDQPGTILGLRNDYNSATITHFVISSFTDSGTIYSLDVGKGEFSKVVQPKTDFNPMDYVVDQVFYNSSDNIKVPMLLVYHKDVKLHDKNNKVLLYAYGAFNVSNTPFFSPRTMSWINSKNIYAFPGVRGGGEYGKLWHESGIKLNKQNGINDYLSAANWLISEGYTKAGNIIANGVSAGGPLVGGALVQNPKLFGGALLDIPVLDMFKYHKSGNSANWTSDFGTIKNVEEYNVLKSYSPYHNITNKFYPPILVTVGEKDGTALPYNGYKFIAKLQSLNKGGPFLLKTVKNSGHSFGANAEQIASTYVTQMRFLESLFN